MVKKTYRQELYDYLVQYVTPNKREKFTSVLSQRTRMLTVVLEDVFKTQNASAVLRTAECIGLQDVHVVEQENKFDLNPYVMRGSGKWLTINHRKKSPDKNNMAECIDQLRQEEYTILATSPHDYAKDFYNTIVDQKTAVIFGSEENGISSYVKENADGFVKIPMTGFTESFNISVSAAVIMENFNRQIRSNLDWNLSSEEKFDLELEWVQKVVPNVEVHLKEFERQFLHKSNNV